MQLPQHLRHFSDGALIVASDTVTAKIFLAGGDAVEALDGVALPKETGRDGEGSFEFFPDDASRLRAFAKKLAVRLTALEREHKIPHIHLVMPAEVERFVTEELANDVATKIGKRIHVDAMNESPINIIERLFETL